MHKLTPFSVLDLVHINEGERPAQALNRVRELAQFVEGLGYRRLWLAEHHGMPDVASAAPAVVIAHVASSTTSIRVGSGGVMLPNHAPLSVAEQFGTLGSFYPGRIDLGLGRAPAADPSTAKALRGEDRRSTEHFEEDLEELRGYFAGSSERKAIAAIDTAVPMWLLGSSVSSARLAARMGLPYAFASHLAPDALEEAVAIYRSSFIPTTEEGRPQVIVAVHVIAGETDVDAAYMFTSVLQSFVSVKRGKFCPLPPPVRGMAGRWTDAERQDAERTYRGSIVGSKQTVKKALQQLLSRANIDEVMIISATYDETFRRRSFELIAEILSQSD
jgi:luciferase family oxidoreductase group 1